jgi:hypothetical protein
LWSGFGKIGLGAFAFRLAARPQRIRTYLVLFALALSLPLLSVSVFGLNRMAAIAEDKTNNRVLAFAKTWPLMSITRPRDRHPTDAGYLVRIEHRESARLS